ncbi:MAG: DEAD/DEAH box helicase, partial [Planctomycetota bacterium]
EQLPYAPYPVQEEALLAWFTAEQGVLVCAPTGTGKTLIAEAAMFEALQTGKTAYYTTPLIALTEQKFREMQHSAVRWGFKPTDVGLVTGNRRENPEARVLVVVAEILLNRLLHPAAFDFSEVSSVVMDEFHSIADPERGVVWELSLGLLPPHVRLLLLSATVGNAQEFINWLDRAHQHRVELVSSQERKVPLVYQWVPDMLLTEQIERMAQGGDEDRFTPCLVFCFNREECWSAAETLKGKRVLSDGQQARLSKALEDYDLREGAGPKLKQILQRGVGVHHAGLLPKYRRVVEDLFQQKLLSVAVCTETLSAGINLPARSVVLPSIAKGPPDKKRVLDPSSAHQMFGRAGRPQFDNQGYVFVLAHEDDVRIARWKEKFDQIPENTKDPGLLKAKKDLKRKMPKRRENEFYWTEAQFQKLRDAPPGKLYSRGPLPWRLLAYMLDASPEVEPIRRLVGKRLMDSGRIAAAQRELDRMLMTLYRAGYVELLPEPPKDLPGGAAAKQDAPPSSPKREAGPEPGGLFSRAGVDVPSSKEAALLAKLAGEKPDEPPPPPPYQPEFAHPTESMRKLVLFRGINPLYAVFLVDHMGIADRAERIQAMESVLELPKSVGHFVRVPPQRELPPGPLATTRLDVLLLELGLAIAEELVEPSEEEQYQRRRSFDEPPPRVLTLAEKLRRLFDYDFPGVHDLRTYSVWAAGEVLEFGGDFNKYVTSKALQKQEGLIFRHLLRMILLVREFMQLCPPDTTEEQWREDMGEIAGRLTECCRKVDPQSTDKALEETEDGAGDGDDTPLV